MSVSHYAPPRTFTAVWAIAALTWRRAVRGRTLWVTGILAVLPLFYAALTYQYAGGFQTMNRTGFARGVFGIVMLTLAISPAMNIASSLGEELEERTSAYLWSRPLARWTIAAGKLLALAPIVACSAVASLLAAHAASDGNLPGPLALAGVAGSAVAFCVVAAAIATIAPKNGMTLAICYALFIDLAMGALPISLRNISISYHATSIAGLSRDSATSGAIGIAVVATIWMMIGLWRIRRME